MTLLLPTMPFLDPFWDMAPSTMRARMAMDAFRFMADCGGIEAFVTFYEMKCRAKQIQWELLEFLTQMDLQMAPWIWW
jgi:hypothetical protein